ncbi:MAG: hypothetical protein ABI779_05420 [Acidobacteriota bacterium]
MKKKLPLFAALALVTMASVPLSARPPIYMKFDGVDGQATANDPKHGGYIELESLSVGSSNSTGIAVKGSRTGTDASCPTSPVRFVVKGTPPADLMKLCQSRQRIGSVSVDINGVMHQLQDASFESCQSGASPVPANGFSLNFTKCTFPGHSHGGVNVAMGDLNASANVQPNARLIGLPTGPVPVHLESLTLNPDGTSGTMGITKLGSGRLNLGSASATPLPKLELELTNGTKWTFLKIKLTDILISGATGQTSGKPMEQFSLNFFKVEGPVAGYPTR